MAASINDKFRKGAAAFSTTLASDKAASAASCSLSSATGLPTDTAVDLTIGRVDSSGTRTPTKKAVYKATISGTTASNLTLVEGTDQLHVAGTVVEVTFTAKTHNDMVDGILVEHNQNGTHAAVTATSLTATGTVQGATVTSTGDLQLRSTSLETIASERFFDHVASGCVWSGDSYGSTRAASMTSGVVYIGGKRVSVSAVSAHTFTASKDTYIDVDNSGALTYTEVTNNAASPSLAANSIRLAIIVTGASNIADVGSINQGQESKVLPIASSIAYAVTDSLGNLICPRDPQRRILGYRQVVANQGPTAWATSDTDLTGLSCPVIVPTNRKIRITFYANNWQTGTTSATGFTSHKIKEGSTVLQTSDTPAGATAGIPVAIGTVIYETTPTAGSHTYKAAYANSTTGPNYTLIASSTSIAYIMVELL